ncbi:MAG: anthranilate phosphoribosyltransferase, partial [Candidatus Latescibacterota bacterium]|nr:anthranilate phosphoribosyltransferase [Candidatus Latescibacterota bacterium]
QILRDVLGGKEGAPRDVVLMNAAAAIAAGGLVETLAEGVERARESIDSGTARGALEKLVALSNA